ncbi:hypothetical protein PanWU01x14_079870, partial [Parasponia andersonii]
LLGVEPLVLTNCFVFSTSYPVMSLRPLLSRCGAFVRKGVMLITAQGMADQSSLEIQLADFCMNSSRPAQNLTVLYLRKTVQAMLNGNCPNRINKGYVVYMLESDWLNAVLAINFKAGLSTEDLLIGDIQSFLLNCQVDPCCYLDRKSNRVANTLVKLCFRNDFIFLSCHDILCNVTDIVAADLS